MRQAGHLPISEAGSRDPRLVQCASTVLMVRPANFGFNAETAGSNRFQQPDATLAAEARARARDEFDVLAAQLRDLGVRTLVAEDRESPACPDAVFPNNWVSLHPDGTVVLYPMLAPSRRRERRCDVVGQVLAQSGRRLSHLLDLTHYELDGQFLEGTGSVVFDHVARVAYACRSPRTHETPLRELCDELGYTACVFDACDPDRVPIYHTNVMLAVGARAIVVAGEAIAPPQRDAVLARLHGSGREVIDIGLEAMGQFAGNMLELRDEQGNGVLAMSTSAAAALGPERLTRLEQKTGRLAIASIPTIERLGGGSVRCMLAEVFLPT